MDRFLELQGKWDGKRCVPWYIGQGSGSLDKPIDKAPGTLVMTACIMSAASLVVEDRRSVRCATHLAAVDVCKE